MPLGFFQNASTGHHHTEVDHLVIIALEHDPHDILADIVHIALHGGHQHLAVGLRWPLIFLGLDERQKIGNGLFHHACGFHHLRQEHLAGAEQVANHVHAIHQRPFDHI